MDHTDASSGTDGNPSLQYPSELALQRLVETINQQSMSAISTLQLPEFSGFLREDVRAFMRKFKLATATLNDKMKCLALSRALQDTAHVWAKNNIKE